MAISAHAICVFEETVSMLWGQAGSRSNGGVSSVCRPSAKLLESQLLCRGGVRG